MYCDDYFCRFFFFFFSSRRRHTRFDCDWSSDVCSSDLAIVVGTAAVVAIVFVMPILQGVAAWVARSEEHTSELQSQSNLVCRLLLEKKKNKYSTRIANIQSVVDINHVVLLMRPSCN